MPYLGKSPARGLVGVNDIDDNAVTLAKMAGGTDGNLITYDASGDPAAVAVGTSGHFLKSQGAGSVPVFAAVSGGLVQTAYVLEGSTTTTTAALPIDTSVPQISEGGEIMTLAITPTSASNKLIIHVHANVATSDTGGAAVAAALYQDSTANALCVGHKESNGSNELNFIHFSFGMTAGTTSSTTFKVRGGYAVAVGTTTFNGQGGAVRGGGVYYSSIVIQEVT